MVLGIGVDMNSVVNSVEISVDELNGARSDTHQAKAMERTRERAPQQRDGGLFGWRRRGRVERSASRGEVKGEGVPHGVSQGPRG